MSDWRNRTRFPGRPPSKRAVAALESLTRGAMGTKRGEDRDGDIAASRAAQVPSPVSAWQPSEASEQQKLTQWALLRSWRLGYRHHEQARAGWAGVQVWQRGQRPGWPDVTVHVAPRMWALELKAKRERPKAPLHYGWWLDWVREIGWKPDTEVRDPTHYGLRASQAWTLDQLDGCGYRTMVAYGADEAIAWLQEAVG